MTPLFLALRHRQLAAALALLALGADADARRRCDGGAGEY
jgi:hypothetical protein